MLIFLTSCKSVTLGGSNKPILVSPKVTTWSVLNEEDLNKPLRDFKDTDILTSDTMRQIKDHNDKVR